MGLIPGFEHDIFISYAHNDNTKLKGWVDTFVETLKDMLLLHLGEKDLLDIWYDQRKIDGSIEFDRSIKEGIEKSAIIICLTSPSYYQSPNCIYELNTFHQKAQAEEIGLLIGNQSRIINVLLFNIPHEKWESALKNRTGFKFYESKDKTSIGDALSVTSEEFTRVQRELRDSLFTLITNIKQTIDTPKLKPLTVKNATIKKAKPVIANHIQPADPIMLPAKRKLNPLFWGAAVLLIVVVAAFWWPQKADSSGRSANESQIITKQSEVIKAESVKQMPDKKAIEKLLMRIQQYADSNETSRNQFLDSVTTYIFTTNFKAIVPGIPSDSGKLYLKHLARNEKPVKIEVKGFTLNESRKVTGININ